MASTIDLRPASGVLAGLVLAGALVFAGTASADRLTFSSKSRNAIFSSQLDVLDGRAASQYSNSIRLQPEREIPGAGLAAPEAYAGEWRGPAEAAARRHEVPVDLFLRLVRAESGWNPRAVSPKGARGLAQLMPETARLLGVDPDDPRQNLEGGARYLRQMYDRFGSWRLALAAYNAGPVAVETHGGLPPYRETVAYVRKIWGS